MLLAVHTLYLNNYYSLFLVAGFHGPKRVSLNFEGCSYKHNFVVAWLRSTIVVVRGWGQPCGIAWLDLSNAFCSVPHKFLEHDLRLLHMPQAAIDVVMVLYAGATRLRTWYGYTESTTLAAGLKHCPILFKLAMEPVIREIQIDKVWSTLVCLEWDLASSLGQTWLTSHWWCMAFAHHLSRLPCEITSKHYTEDRHET